MNIPIHDSASLSLVIASNKGLILYFYNDSCAPCISLRPKVQTLVDNVFPMLHLEFINSLEYPELPVAHGIFSSPAILVFFEGKEFIRESKYVSIEDLQEKIERYYAMVFGI
jgi:thioredoxin 1